MTDTDFQGTRKYILSQLCDGENLLMIAVYMVQVDIVTVWQRGFSRRWRRISYGNCLSLLLFAKAEKVAIEHQLQQEAGREPWQAFLRTLKDKAGKPLEVCILCEHNIRDVIFMPCGHFVACRVCAEKWRLKSDTCPYCRTKVARIESVRDHVNEAEDGQKTIPYEMNTEMVSQRARLRLCSLLTRLCECRSEKCKHQMECSN